MTTMPTGGTLPLWIMQTRLGGGLYLAVSYDGNPLLGFQTFHIPNFFWNGARSDYPKIGFNRDAIFIS